MSVFFEDFNIFTHNQAFNTLDWCTYTFDEKRLSSVWRHDHGKCPEALARGLNWAGITSRVPPSAIVER